MLLDSFHEVVGISSKCSLDARLWPDFKWVPYKVRSDSTTCLPIEVSSTSCSLDDLTFSLWLLDARELSYCTIVHVGGHFLLEWLAAMQHPIRPLPPCL